VNRWAAALSLSLLFHTGAAVGTLGPLHGTPSLEVAAGEARVAVVFRSKPIPPRSALSFEPAPQKKSVEPVTVIPEMEGVESNAPQSLHNPPPSYPSEAFRRGIQGVTALLVAVSPEGNAALVQIERSSGSLLLDEAAAQTIAKWVFLPARWAGVPVAGSIRIRVRFQIAEPEEF
jgi:protein TonB